MIHMAYTVYRNWKECKVQVIVCLSRHSPGETEGKHVIIQDSPHSGRIKALIFQLHVYDCDETILVNFVKLSCLTFVVSEVS